VQKSGISFFHFGKAFLSTVLRYVVHSPTNALFINLYAVCSAHSTHATVEQAATSPTLYNNVILLSVLT
jgi:hypothetical protein